MRKRWSKSYTIKTHISLKVLYSKIVIPDNLMQYLKTVNLSAEEIDNTSAEIKKILINEIQPCFFLTLNYIYRMTKKIIVVGLTALVQLIRPLFVIQVFVKLVKKRRFTVVCLVIEQPNSL
jgi:hypothetical protein